ncbi:GntR family transcriptional regulator [soil metagenome]
MSWRKVAEGLQIDIISSQLQPREHLVEDDVMRRFSASRYAVRRALEELVALGLAVRTENRGTRIRGYSSREVAELYEMRELLETGAARRIAMPPAKALVDELVEIQKRHDRAMRAADVFELYTANNEFHRTLFGACDNQTLVDAIVAYALQVQPIRMRLIHDDKRKKQASVEHWEMIEALKEGDTESLVAVCGRHISLSKVLYLKQNAGLGIRA